MNIYHWEWLLLELNLWFVTEGKLQFLKCFDFSSFCNLLTLRIRDDFSSVELFLLCQSWLLCNCSHLWRWCLNWVGVTDNFLLQEVFLQDYVQLAASINECDASAWWPWIYFHLLSVLVSLNKLYQGASSKVIKIYLQKYICYGGGASKGCFVLQVLFWKFFCNTTVPARVLYLVYHSWCRHPSSLNDSCRNIEQVHRFCIHSINIIISTYKWY